VRAGATALVLGDGTIEGFVGGHCAEPSVRLHALRALETGEALLLRIEPGDGEVDALEGAVTVHNPCISGGALEIFLEPQLPAARVVIAGATPIAVALEQVARAAGFDAVRGEPAEVVPHATDAALVVASHGIDEEVTLARALEAGVGYVGLVASRRRGTAVREALDVPDALRPLLHTPAGLDIGARTAAEVAVSILAQIVGERTAGAHPQPAESPPLAITMPATATDPVCGMEVVAAEATVHLDDGGRRVYFCCEGCRSTYAADPLRHGGA
jgi:xanthine dehydrogenase accessory factor